jgi:sugar phosphate isomerase/epimerase
MFDERICVGLPCLAGCDLDKALTKVKKLGFQSIMGLPGTSDSPHKHSLGEFATLGFKPDSIKNNLKLCSQMNSFSNISIHQDWNDDWKSWFNCAEQVGAKVVTVHAPILPDNDCPEIFLKRSVKKFRKMGDYAKDKNIMLGVENIGGAVEIYKRLINRINHPAVGATLDFGHFAYFQEIASIPNIDYRCDALNNLVNATIFDLKDKLLHIHIHNVRKIDWRDHRSIQTGALDYQIIFKSLNKIKYQRLFDLELEEPEQEKQLIATGEYLQLLLTN